MRNSGRPSLARPGSRFFRSLAATTALIALSACPGLADVVPESALLIHVQPVSEPCLTSLTNCNQLIHTTNAQGEMEFLLYFYPIWVQGDGLRIRNVHTSLVWPANWQLIDAHLCSGSWGGFDGGTLNIEWWDEPLLPEFSGGVFLLARLVINVNGPGRLDFADAYDNPVGLQRDGVPFVSYATGFPTEAGMGCEYYSHRCAHYEFCYFGFQGLALELSAPPDGITVGELEFPLEGCGALSINPGADWAQAVVERIDGNLGLIRVTANAAGLPSGVYETSIQVSRPLKARCLPVTFTVLGTASAPDDRVVVRRSWGAIKATGREGERVGDR